MSRSIPHREGPRPIFLMLAWSGGAPPDEIWRSWRFRCFFIRGLRAGVNTWNRAAVYALLVFDFALIQLGGLSFGSSGNRIADPRAAGVVTAFAAEWYTNIAKLATT